MSSSFPGTLLRLALLLTLAACPPVRADDAAAQPLLAQLDSKSATRPDLALAGLAQIEAAIRDATPAMQRRAWLRIRRLQRDVGDFKAAAASNERLRALGTGTGDQEALAEAALGDIDDMIRGYQFTRAKAAQQQLEKSFRLGSMPEVNYHAQMSFGRMYLLNSEYERTLGYFEAGRQLAGQMEDPAAARAEAALNLAQLYNASKDTRLALRYAEQVLKEGPGALRPRLRSNLYYTRALVLVGMERLDEAAAEFSRSLEIARASGIHVMHAHVLGNMADLALRRQRWREAEQLAREALDVSSRIHDESAELMAKANIGFALGGQGRIEAATVYLDEVIKKFRNDANLQALSGMLDEKAAMLERAGQLKEAMAVLREQQVLERKQYTADRAKAVAGMQEKFALAENQRRIEQLQEENRLKDATIHNRELKQLALGLAALLLLASGGFVWMLYRRAGRSNLLLRELNAKLEYHAVRDPLTGLYNRRSFVERMQARSAPARPERRSAPAVKSDIFLILDLDHFKRVNDTHGHGAGDAVLVEVARRLQTVVRDSDTVLRWGGEEFVIHSSGHDGAAALAARILEVIGATPIAAGNLSLQVTASAGLIELPFANLGEPVLNWERALQLADAALYRAKATGRNRCCHLLGMRDAGADPAGLADLDPVAVLALLDLATIEGPVQHA